ncbi:MAG: AAA family ATPase [Intestinimonas sp.]
MAGEAGVNSSPSRVRTLWSSMWAWAPPGPRSPRPSQKDSPAIVFIDEIDAVGRQRGAGRAAAMTSVSRP